MQRPARYNGLDLLRRIFPNGHLVKIRISLYNKIEGSLEHRLMVVIQTRRSNIRFNRSFQSLFHASLSHLTPYGTTSTGVTLDG